MSIYSPLELERILDIHEPPIQGKEMAHLEWKFQAAQRRAEIAARVAATLVAKEKRRVAKILARTLKATEPLLRKKEKERDIKETIRIMGGMKAQRINLDSPETWNEEVLYMTIAIRVQIRTTLHGKQKRKFEEGTERLLLIGKKKGYASTLDEVLSLVLCIPIEIRNEFCKEVRKFLVLV